MRRDSREVLSRPVQPPDFTVAYGDHPDQLADVRLPTARPWRSSGGPGGGPMPLVLFLHGGFWRSEYDRSHTGPLAAALASEGFAVVTPEYRRTGSSGGGWPGTFDDVAAAVRAVPRLVADRANVEPSRVVLAGHSAGGHLALWAAARLGVGGLRGVVALAPVADLRAAYDLDLDDGAVATLLGGTPEEVPERYAATDPMVLTPVGATLAIVHGVLDQQVPVEFSRRFATRAAAAGDGVQLHELPDIDHFDVIDPLSPAWSIVVGTVRAMQQGWSGVDACPDRG